ncbi:MAG: transporter substrate-binding domain-containing protein [Pseudomonas sp.]|uniref:substrate-binding periplasmic protein n=1 Tax=Pseudomonas sp. TaxID=306 RepID=UPI00398259D8
MKTIPHGAWLAALLMLLCSAVRAETIQAVTEDSLHAFMDGDKVSGPATAVVERTLNAAGLEYQLALYPWARAYDMALQQPNVLIYLILRTPEREQLFKWVGEVKPYKAYLYKLRQRQDIQVNSLEDAKRYSIGVVRDDVRHAYLKSQGFTKLFVAPQNHNNMRQLLNGQIDLLPLLEGDAKRLSKEAGADFTSLEQVMPLDGLITGLYLAYSNATEDAIVERTRRAFEQLRSSGEIVRLMENSQ